MPRTQDAHPDSMMVHPIDKRWLTVANPDNTDTFEARLGGLLAALERHDEGTRYHSESVAAWSGRIAKVLGLAPATRQFVERCAILHDVGKLFTPERILRKPGTLNAEEWAEMRAHAANGADLLASIPQLAEYAGVVRAHHERQDGAGYPDKLAGSEIPFEASIISVADAFDAMISTRSYRPPMAPLHALDELQRCRGTQFEPSIVDTLVAIVALPQRPRLYALAAS